jgi:hypothetical protein
VFGTNGTVVSTSDGGTTWTYSPVRYWKTGIYNFYAVSPADKATGTLSESGLSLSFDDGWDLSKMQTDLLIAKQAVDDGSNKVSLTFDHMLSQISFSARNAAVNGDVELSVTSVKVYGLYKTATGVTINSAGATEWSLQYKSTIENPFKTDSQAKVLTNETTDRDGTKEYKYTNVCPSFMVFPETSEFVVEVTYNQVFGNTTTQAVKSATISTRTDAGYEYDFKLKITEDAISIDGEPGVVPWVSKDDDDNDLVIDDTIVI